MRWSFLYELQINWWSPHISVSKLQVSWCQWYCLVAIQMEGLQGWRNLVHMAIAIGFRGAFWQQVGWERLNLREDVLSSATYKWIKPIVGMYRLALIIKQKGLWLLSQCSKNQVPQCLCMKIDNILWIFQVISIILPTKKRKHFFVNKYMF